MIQLIFSNTQHINMINQQSSSQISNSQVLLTKRQLIEQILQIKYQQQQLKNKAYRQLQLFLKPQHEIVDEYTIQLFGNIHWKEFNLFTKDKQFIQGYYPMTHIMRNIQKIIRERINRDHNHPVCLSSYENLKYNHHSNCDKFRSFTINPKKTARDTSSTSKNSKTKQKNINFLNYINFQEESSVIIRKVEEDLSQILRDFCRSRVQTQNLKLDLKLKQQSKLIPTKQREFKKRLVNANISQIQPLTLENDYEINQQLQMKEAVWDYGLKKNIKKRQTSKSTKKKIKASSYSLQKKIRKSTSNIIHFCGNKMNIPCEKTEEKWCSEASGISTFRNSQKPHYAPLTPTPRYMQSSQKQQYRQWRDSSENYKRKKKDIEDINARKTNISKQGPKRNILNMKKSRDSIKGLNRQKLLSIKSKQKNKPKKNY